MSAGIQYPRILMSATTDMSKRLYFYCLYYSILHDTPSLSSAYVRFTEGGGLTHLPRLYQGQTPPKLPLLPRQMHNLALGTFMHGKHADEGWLPEGVKKVLLASRGPINLDTVMKCSDKTTHDHLKDLVKWVLSCAKMKPQIVTRGEAKKIEQLIGT